LRLDAKKNFQAVKKSSPERKMWIQDKDWSSPGLELFLSLVPPCCTLLTPVGVPLSHAMTSSQMLEEGTELTVSSVAR
jgi:hypothetical protein